MRSSPPGSSPSSAPKPRRTRKGTIRDLPPPRAEVASAGAALGTGIGPYRVTHRLAVGGMAEVYRALTTQAAGADRSVVIKRMLPDLLEQRGCREMFEEEARLGLLIDHPNVVPVLDRGVHEGAPYLVLEYVFGVDLWQLVRSLTKRGEKLDVSLALFIVIEMLQGLEGVHSAVDEEGHPLEVIHRDVSPSNIFLSVHGDVKLGDLGIARAALRRTRPAGVLTARAKGKLGYVAPEQLGESNADQRADVFAAGVVAAELLMGRPLFQAATELAVLLAIRDGDVLPFRQFAEELEPGLGSAILGALERAPEERTASAREMRRALEPFLRGDREALREELGAVVVRTLQEEEKAEGEVDRASLARTIEAQVGDLTSLTASGARTPTPPLAAAGPAGKGHYQVPRRGPASLRYADLVRLIVAGEVGPRDEVRTPGEQVRGVAQVPELARHLPPSSRTPTLRRARMAETNELHELGSSFGLLAILGRTLLARETGLLLCEHGKVRKEVYVTEGVPSFVTSNRPGDLLGEHLVKEGVIERGELDLALAVMPRFEGHLGDTLIALGLVEPIHLVRHIARKVEDKLVELFTWTAGRVAFYRSASPPEGGFPLGLDPWAVLLDGAEARRQHGLDPAKRAALSEMPLKRTDVITPAVAQAVEPPRALVTVLDALERPRTAGQLARQLSLRPDDLERQLAVLLAMDAIRLHEGNVARSD